MKMNLLPYRIRLTRIVLIPLIAGSLILETGCFKAEKKAAQDLVRTGSSTSDQLAKFYDTLVADSEATLNFVGFENVREGKDLSTDAKFKNAAAEFKTEREAVAARAQMARAMKGVYDSLGKLIDYDAAGDVTASVVNLKKEIENVSKKKLPKAAGVDPEAILKKATTILVTWIQLKQFHKNAPRAEEVLDGVMNLFVSEKSAYVNIIQDFNEHAYTNAKYFVDNDLALNSSVYAKSFEVFGLQYTQIPPGDTLTDPEKLKKHRADIKSFTSQWLVIKKNDLNDAATKAPDAVSSGLAELKKAHEDFNHGKYKKPEEGSD